jgi:hypothetical protein
MSYRAVLAGIARGLYVEDKVTRPCEEPAAIIIRGGISLLIRDDPQREVGQMDSSFNIGVDITFPIGFARRADVSRCGNTLLGLPYILN